LRAGPAAAGQPQWQRKPSVYNDFLGLILTPFQAKQVRDNHVAILIDEIDSYIVASRQKHGDEFPLASALRSVAQTEAPGGHLRVVMAGFKALYSEVKRKGIHKSDFPFHQFLLNTPPLDALHESETREILQVGFMQTLGISFESSVPRLVHERSGGHPAFVQEFCNCLLKHLEKHRRKDQLVLTAADVDTVFGENAVREGQPPFIEFVDDTLGMNFSSLERAVFLLLVYAIKDSAEAAEKQFGTKWIVKEVDEWLQAAAGSCGQERLTSDVKRALSMLVMTGMLNFEAGSYRIAIPPYVDILQRLDECKKDLISEFLVAYYEEGKSS